MKLHRTTSRNNSEKGLIITLVAVFVLFVLGAMAALSIDVVTFYTARSEAQLAADGAALAGARVLANSGATSNPAALMSFAETFASAVATQVAQQNSVGGRALQATEVTVTFPSGTGSNPANPTVKVSVQRTDIPTFFARIWGKTKVTVGASATAEAYNPSQANFSSQTPVAPLCVKPWLLPNMDPSNSGNPIFVVNSGVVNPGSNLLGWTFNTQTTGKAMIPACTSGTCTTPLPAPQSWYYYPGDDDPTSFPHPTYSLPTCNPVLTTDYQESIAGCVQTPMSCNQQTVNVDMTAYGTTRNSDTANAVNCLTHANGGGDTITITPAPPAAPPPTLPFQFVAGAGNPIPGLNGNDVMVSDSIVTVPVFDTAFFNQAGTNFHIVGFVQLFLNPDGNPTPASGQVNAAVINLAGCGSSWTAQPIIGNGASPVTVRLILH